ncbi:MAG TPA: sigma-70 family RNA polymerase sigma factor [Terriglobales bacterium]|nr:sigma-70 family RNA polymerase sigma factor [Terriglobales bacterium]
MLASRKKNLRQTMDRRLVKRCLAGDEQAWAELIESYKSLIYSIPVKYGLPPHDASDIFQATCMELLERLPDIREPSALPKWLIQVAHHKCYHWKRQQSRSVSRDGDDSLPEPEVPPVAESLVRQTEEEQMLREATRSLAPRCKRLIQMLFFETPARPYEQIAAELGLAVGSIGFTRQQCLERLRSRLEELGFM